MGCGELIELNFSDLRHLIINLLLKVHGYVGFVTSLMVSLSN